MQEAFEEEPSEVVRQFYLFCRETIDGIREETEGNRELREWLGGEQFSFEQAFWISFVSVALCTWDHTAEDEIRLSEIFRVYLTIYRAKIAPDMGLEDGLSFLHGLKEKYDQANRILRDEAESRVPLKLAQLALRDEMNVWRVILASYHILSNTIASLRKGLPARLIKDV